MSWQPGQIAVGFVSAVDETRARARVRFPDQGNRVSDWLQVTQRRTRGMFDYALPAINEHVLCVLLGTGIEQGFVVAGLYDGDNLPPVAGDVLYTQAPNGDLVCYHIESGELVITASGGVTITGDVNIIGTLSVSGDVTAGEAGISLVEHIHWVSHEFSDSGPAKNGGI